MQNLFFKRLQKLIGVFFLLETLIGILIIVKNITNIIQVITAAIVSIMFGTLSFLLLKNDSSKKKVKNSDAICADKPQERDYSKQTEYVQDGNVIYRADGKKISDEEVPYLMQLGYEESLRQTGQYNGEVLDTSFVVQSLAKKKNATIIPTYQEIINFPTNCSSKILSTDIFFLKYIDGRSVENANIAQYWYYEYGLNYANELKKLYSSDMLRISNVNISKLKVVDLKNILRHFNLPLSGKKADLTNRILDNISSEDLSSF